MTQLRSFFLALLMAFSVSTGSAVAQEMFAAPAPMEIAQWEVPALPDHWDTVHAPFIRIHGDDADYGAMLALSRHASESLPRLATELGVPIGDTIHVVVAPTHGAFRDLQPGNAPSWADGVAYPALGVLYLHSPGARDSTGTPLEKVLDHELIHILLGRAFYPNRVPMWLQEGVAKVYAKEVTPQNTEALARGMMGSGLLSLTALDGSFPRDPVKAQLAYAQSSHFIGFLGAEYGEDTVPKLIRSLVQGNEIDAAIYHATGHWLDAVDESWRASLQTGIPLSFTALTLDGVLLGLGGVALLIGGVFRRRRFHKRLEEMGEEEALVDELMEKIRREEAEQAIAQEWENMRHGGGLPN